MQNPPLSSLSAFCLMVYSYSVLRLAQPSTAPLPLVSEHFLLLFNPPARPGPEERGSQPGHKTVSVEKWPKKMEGDANILACLRC